MDVVLKHLVSMESWVFIDGMIIYSKSAQEHTQWLENA
jgi:hypothetical protein